MWRGVSFTTEDRLFEKHGIAFQAASAYWDSGRTRQSRPVRQTHEKPPHTYNDSWHGVGVPGKV